MDIYKEVTDRIISQMENGIIPWQKPWVAAGSCISHVTGKPYSLLNQMMLGKAGEYVTFKQCQQEGGRVKKGEKASMVVFWKWIEQKNEETGEVKELPFLRYYNVFHIDQCEGLTEKHAIRMPATANADVKAESIIATYVQQSGIKLIHQAGDRAFYPWTAPYSSAEHIILECNDQAAHGQVTEHQHEHQAWKQQQIQVTVPVYSG